MVNSNLSPTTPICKNSLNGPEFSISSHSQQDLNLSPNGLVNLTVLSLMISAMKNRLLPSSLQKLAGQFSRSRSQSQPIKLVFNSLTKLNCGLTSLTLAHCLLKLNQAIILKYIMTTVSDTIEDISSISSEV